MDQLSRAGCLIVLAFLLWGGSEAKAFLNGSPRLTRTDFAARGSSTPGDHSLIMGPKHLLPVQTWRICKVCKKQFLPEENGPTACRFHASRWIGAEASKHHGTRSGGGRVGLESFWDCCDGESVDAPGCVAAPHCSYDEDDGQVFVNYRVGDRP